MQYSNFYESGFGKNSKEKRFENIDVAKGIGILLMIAGHIFNNSVFGTIVYGFHMPLFFIITGILRAKRKRQCGFGVFAKKRFFSLIVPYVIVEIITLPLFCLKHDYTVEDWRWIILDSLLLYYNRGGATWFLLNLFLSELEFFWIEKIKNRTLYAVVACILFVMGTMCTSDNHIVFIILRSFVAVGFIALGYFYASDFLKKRSGLGLWALPIVYIFFSLKNGLVDMNLGEYQNQLLYFLCAVTGSLSVMAVSNWITSNTVIIKRTLAFWGGNSMIVVCTHLIPMRYLIDICFNIGPRYAFGVGCAIFAFVLCFECFLIKVCGYCRKKLTLAIQNK